MILGQARQKPARDAFPRTRGDDPSEAIVIDPDGDFSPHPRG